MIHKRDMSERLKKILRENAEFEKETPYNFCDRWCERCATEKQVRCTLYKDEFEQKITCIAHGKDPDNPEITEQVMRWQMDEMEKKIEEAPEKSGVDFDVDSDGEGLSEFQEEEERIEKELQKDPLLKAAGSYLKLAHLFLKKTFENKKAVLPGLAADFDTVAWYHALLPVKLNRALAGLRKEADEDEFGLCDAIAQFQICKKSTGQSINALRKIAGQLPEYRQEIASLMALLHNIDSRIKMLEESIG